MADQARQIYYGVGVGADVAAARTFNQLSFGLKPAMDTVNNESAWGNIVRTNSSSVLREWSEGELEHKLGADSAGYILLGAFGSLTTTDNADTNPAVKDHTFNINNNINGQALTLWRKDSLQTEKYTNAKIGEWNLQVDLDDYIKFTAGVMGSKAQSGVWTPAMVRETEFTAKYFTIKQAANVAGLGAASNLTKVQSFSLTMNPNIERDNETGNDEPYGFSSRGYELEFEMTARYEDNTFRNAYQAGTPLAWQITIANTDVTIGAAANPKLVLTAPTAVITDWDRDEGNLDDPVNQVMTGTIHYSPADAYALRAILTNTTASYA